MMPARHTVNRSGYGRRTRKCGGRTVSRTG
nr:MAG TPA: hypothetical protein [Caudoviricetes sp.]